MTDTQLARSVEYYRGANWLVFTATVPHGKGTREVKVGVSVADVVTLGALRGGLSAMFSCANCTRNAAWEAHKATAAKGAA